MASMDDSGGKIDMTGWKPARKRRAFKKISKAKKLAGALADAKAAERRAESLEQLK